MKLRFPIGEIFAAAMITVIATAVYAQDTYQDWVPKELSFPDDTEVVADRAIGSSVRMLSFTTDASISDLFAEWEESLESSGYRITQAEGEILDQSIEFSGQNISNAKIIVAPTTNEDGRKIIELDATLN